MERMHAVGDPLCLYMLVYGVLAADEFCVTALVVGGTTVSEVISI